MGSLIARCMVCNVSKIGDMSGCGYSGERVLVQKVAIGWGSPALFKAWNFRTTVEACIYRGLKAHYEIWAS